MAVIQTADILLPVEQDMSKWSVIACDQFTSEPAYWSETKRLTDGKPSTLNMILPEAYIGTNKAENAPERVRDVMQTYLDEGIFKTLKNAFLYVERETTGGRLRHGLLAAVDLDSYEYLPEKSAALKATEKTVEERLLKRLELRKSALLELPHVLIFLNDPEDRVASIVKAAEQELKTEYDFDLMQGGGHIRGRSVTGAPAEQLLALFKDLEEQAEKRAAEQPGTQPVMLAVADGNHSLATAKHSWEQLKKTLPEEAWADHPARYALAELVNVYDEGVFIEPIHRILKKSETEGLPEFAEAYFRGVSHEGAEKTVTVGTADKRREITVRGLSAGDIVAQTDRMLELYMAQFGGEEDYIHDNASAEALGSEPGCAYVLLPAIDRSEIFATAEQGRVFPKKAFSIGNARDKRYYLECRRILPED